MNDSVIPDSRSLDARQLSVHQINQWLSELPPSVTTLDLIGGDKPDLLAPGFKNGCRLVIHGDLGDFCLCGVSNAEIEVKGLAGCGLGEAMESGSILLSGDAGDAAGAFNRGGLVAIYGSAGRRTAVGMCGGDMVVKGSIGSQGAMGMTAGALLILGSAGKMLGQGMHGGTIYIRGDTESLAPHLEETRMREADRLRISLLLLNSGIENEARNFRVLKVGI